MTLTATQIANTTAAEFDVQLRYFAAAADYDTLILAYYEANTEPIGWTISGDTITPDGTWVEITDRVYGRGSLAYEWAGSALRWSTELQGQNYDAAYLQPGRALLCLRRIVRGAYDSGWLIWWLGIVDGGAWRDDYRLGLAWQRSVKGTDASLRLTDGPRLSIGATNAAIGASATAGSTLATPASEAGYGEFVGTTADVAAARVVDQRLNTAWIGSLPPTSTTETLSQNLSAPKIDEVFFKPLAGYDAAKCWWFEVVNTASTQAEISVFGWFLAYTSGGQHVALWIPPGTTLKYSERIVVCGDRAAFDAYTGGASSAIEVYAANELPHSYVCTGFTKKGASSPYEYNINLDRTTRVNLTLNAAGGYVMKVPGDLNGIGSFLGGNNGEGVKWGTNRALPTGLDATEVATTLWNGATVNIGALTDGDSIRRSPTGGGAGSGAIDSNTAADWIIETYPVPGDKFSTSRFDWVRVDLPEHESTLDANITPASTEIKITEGTLGWPPTGDGVIEADTFSYTGRTADTLTGVTGLVSNHTAGALLYPYVDGVAQTGWRCTSVKLRRRPGLAYVKRWEVWIAPTAVPTHNPDGATPADLTWRMDYVEPHYTGTNINGISLGGFMPGAADIGVNLAPDTGARWVRSILINILEMFPNAGEVVGARAKLNEVEVTYDELTLPDGATVLLSAKAGDLAEYLVDTYSWLQLSDFDEASGPGWGQIGSLGLAIRPLPEVLEDLARTHGCLIVFGLDGQLTWLQDPWWPGGITEHPDSASGPVYNFDAASVRGEIEFNDSAPAITGVAIMAQDGDGNPLERVTAPPGVTGSGVREFTGYTVADQGAAQMLAYALEMRETQPRFASLRVKGIGEWCWPTQVYYVTWPNGSIQGNQGVYIAERVTWTWGPGQWECRLDLRQMYEGAA